MIILNDGSLLEGVAVKHFVKFILIIVKLMKDIIPCIIISSDVLLDYFINYV